MEKYYIINDNNRADNPSLTQGEGKKRGRREQEERKKRVRREQEERKHRITWWMLRVAAMLWGMMALMAQSEAQTAQTGLSGVYYIANYYQYNANDPSKCWYLVPAKDPQVANTCADAFYSPDCTSCDPEKPFMTTYQTNRNDNDTSIWILKEVEGESGFYYMIHAMTGKYLVYEPPFSGGNSGNGRRKSFHLQTQADLVLDDSAKFEITSVPSSVGAWNENQRLIRIKELTSGNRFLNPAGDQMNYYHANSKGSSPFYYLGLVGVYSEYEGGNNNGNRNSRWYTESARCQAPVITYDETNHQFNITWHGLSYDQLPADYMIHYSINDVEDEYTGPITASDCILRAWVVGYGMVLSETAEENLYTGTMPPTFEVTCDDGLVMNCATEGASIYYRINNEITIFDPNDVSFVGSLYEGPINSDSAIISGCPSNCPKIYAFAYLNEGASSLVDTIYRPNTQKPVISVSGNIVTISNHPDASSATIYYTLDGSIPDPENAGSGQPTTEYNVPFSIAAYEAQDLEIHAIAKLPDRGASCPVTVMKRPQKPVIEDGRICLSSGPQHVFTIRAQQPSRLYYYALTNGDAVNPPQLEEFKPYTGQVDIDTVSNFNPNFTAVVLYAYSRFPEEINVSVVPSVITSVAHSLSFISPPTIIHTLTDNGASVTITGSGSGTIKYQINGGTEQTYDTPFDLDNGQNYIITATVEVSDDVSCPAIHYVNLPKEICDLGDIDNMNGAYILTCNINASGFTTSIGTTSAPFKGSFDGGGYTISDLQVPLFGVTNSNAIVRNINLKKVNISKAGNVGAIVCEAKGYTRIYNCGILPTTANFPDDTHSSVAATGSSGCAGGIVGKLENNSRVVNCFSYADVSSSGIAAGIVGNNTIASTAAVTDGKYTKLCTVVVNCMFYGNITGGTKQYGVYGGQLITNAATTGINSYNYYRNGSSFTTASGEPTAYNCSFPAEERYLTQVEFHRSLLNSNRELCGWWVGSDVAPSTLTTAQVQDIPKDATLMYKWVLDPNIAPYPILKPFGKYPSIVNPFTGTPWFDHSAADPYEGKQLGTLTVTVHPGTHAAAGVTSTDIDLPITHMDTLHNDYCYRKVQLPYFNTVFGNPNGADWAAKYAGNYTEWVVTGWKVTAVKKDGAAFEGENHWTAQWETGYNYADRKCTDKDLYSVSSRVFAQGGCYYVPDEVDEIEIEAYWGKAIYVRNAGDSYDRVNITTSDTEVKTGTHFAPAGIRDNNVNGATIQTTSKLNDALNNTTIPTKATVYDYALVLVGNVQESVGKNDFVHPDDATRGFTIMSVDLDFDEEPDYCLEWQLGYNMIRQVISPVRFDFLPVVELGIAGKLHGSKYFLSLGCYRSKGHFEVTETAFIRFGQFEFELGTRDEGPVILNGGIYDQYCRGRNGETTQNINYVLLGGHVIMPSFTPGAHVAASYNTRHCAVNALGGDFTSFYLTGGYREDISPNQDNPHCYIDGGHFGTIAAAYKEGIWGNVTWRINHALIGEFYGGGVMAQATGNNYKIVKGNIDVVVDNSIVRKYCGGPKFGDMVDGKTVTTSATGTIFTQYFGAGNGGTNYTQYKSTDATGAPITDWSSTVNSNYHVGQYRSADHSYEADYDIEVINTSTGNQSNHVVNRSYYYAAQFATTNTGNVTNTLTDCTIETNFYGAGFLGGVQGSVTSVLTDTDVYGSAYGAGYSASAGTVTIYNKDKIPPKPNVYTGMIKPQEDGSSNTYFWCNNHGSTSSPATEATAATHDTAYFFTEIPLVNLGAVSNDVTLIITGNSKIGTLEGGSLVENTGNVYGGGDQSAVTGNTAVHLLDEANILGNVYGGGNNGEVGGDSEVVIQNTPVISGTTPFTGSTMVTISGPAGASLYYTTDENSTPTASSTLYIGSFSLEDTTTVKAIAIKNGVSSPVVTKVFTKQQ